MIIRCTYSSSIKVKFDIYFGMLTAIKIFNKYSSLETTRGSHVLTWFSSRFPERSLGRSSHAQASDKLFTALQVLTSSSWHAFDCILC